MFNPYKLYGGMIQVKVTCAQQLAAILIAYCTCTSIINLLYAANQTDSTLSVRCKPDRQAKKNNAKRIPDYAWHHTPRKVDGQHTGNGHPSRAHTLTGLGCCSHSLTGQACTGRSGCANLDQCG